MSDTIQADIDHAILTAAFSEPARDRSPASSRPLTPGEEIDPGTREGDVLGENTNNLNQILLGFGGNDVYLLHRNTGHDEIQEHHANTEEGDPLDSIRVASDIKKGEVRLTRDGTHLLVELLSDDRSVTDSLKVVNYYLSKNSQIERIEFEGRELVWDKDYIGNNAAIRGGSGNDLWLLGDRDKADVFDGDNGGNDILYGLSGNDIYLLGRHTDHDTIDETFLLPPGDVGDAGDKIRVKTGIGLSDVQLTRSGLNLVVQLLDEDRTVNNSLTVKNYYDKTQPSAKIESIEFTDNPAVTWEEAEILAKAAIRGTSGDDTLGQDNDGIDDRLLGGGGNDVYLLGEGTGHDTIEESVAGVALAADVIQLKEGIGRNRVSLDVSEDGRDLIVNLKDSDAAGSDDPATDSLTVKDFYVKSEARIEQIKLHDGTVIWNEVDLDVLPEDRKLRTPLRGWFPIDGFFGDDAFDPKGGEGSLEGFSGNDNYWLGRGTGNHWIREWLGGSGDEDTIRIKSDVSADDVRITRSGDGWHYVVEILEADATGLLNKNRRRATDSYVADTAYYGIGFAGGLIEKVDFSNGTVWSWEESGDELEIIGGAGADTLTGNSTSGTGDGEYQVSSNDIFNSEAGGNDILRGLGGDDVYILGHDTDSDTIQEAHDEVIPGEYQTERDDGGDDGDTVRIKAGISESEVQLTIDGDNLKVELIRRVNGAVVKTGDSLTVEDHYTNDKAKIERVELTDSSGNPVVWDTDDIACRAALRGTAQNDMLTGTSGTDVFDGNAGGVDTLMGGVGDDIYWLSFGSGHDMVKESADNSGAGDSGDTIKITSEVTDITNIRLRRPPRSPQPPSDSDLIVEIVGADGTVRDSLTVLWHYDVAGTPSARVERIEAAGKVLLDEQFDRLIQDMAAFDAGTSSFGSAAAIYDHHWNDIDSLTTPGS